MDAAMGITPELYGYIAIAGLACFCLGAIAAHLSHHCFSKGE